MGQVRIDKNDILWSYLGNFFRVAVNILLLPVVLKLLTDEELGMWYVFVGIGQMVVLLDFGFAATVARNITYIWCGATELKKRSVSNDSVCKEVDLYAFKLVLETCRTIYFVIALVAFLLLVSFGTFYIISLDRSFILAWEIYALAVGLNLLYCYYTSFLRGIGAIAENNKASVLSKAVQIAASFLLLYMGWGLLGIAIAYLLSAISLRIASNIYFNRYEGIGKRLKTIKLKHRYSEVRKSFGIIWYNASRDGLVTLSDYLSTQANTLICSSVLGLTSAGAFGLSVQLATIVGTIAGIPFTSFLPKMQEKAVKNDTSGSRHFFSMALFMFVVGFLVLSLMVLSALPIIKLLKPTLEISYLILAGVLLNIFLFRLYHLCASYISTFNILPYTKAFVISSLISVILSYILSRWTSLGIWALVLSPLGISLLYNAWKWPKEALKMSHARVGIFLYEGYDSSMQFIRAALNRNRHE